MNVLSFLNELRPALPISTNHKGDNGECIPMSNSELRRLIEQKSVLINGRTDFKWNEDIPDDVWELVFFPKSVKAKSGTKYAKRTTVI